MGELQVPAARVLGGVDAARRRELPDLRTDVPAPLHPRSRAHQGCGGRGQRRARPSRRSKIAALIADAAKRVADGEFDDHFPIDIFQTGSGTSTNTNANEVIANVANERGGLGARIEVARPSQRPRELRAVVQRRDPDDDPRRRARGDRPRPRPGARAAARRRLHAKAQTSSPTSSRPGRTHLMDATPVTLGPGVRRLRAADRARHRAHPQRAAATR